MSKRKGNTLRYTDHHVHTSWSPDSSADASAYVKSAKAMGSGFVMFTDHVDFGTPDPMFLRKPDYTRYFQVMKELSELHEFPIQVGVEIGYEKDHKSRIESFLAEHPFDFVIASIHYGDGRDFYQGDFFDGKTQQGAYQRYFELVQEMAENFSAFDVAGHLDFITRYGPFDDKRYERRDFQTVIDQILRALIQKERGIEVNTSGLRADNPRLFPQTDVLARYRELGGHIVTIGSDSHFNHHYAAGIPAAMDELKSLGFEAVYSFTERKASRMEIL